VGREAIPSHIRLPHGSKETSMKRLLNLDVLEAKDTPSSITLDGSIVNINASVYGDTVHVSFDDRGTWWTPFDDQLNISLTNASETLHSTVNAMSVTEIVFRGYDGNDSFTNATGHRSTAYGGNGDDALVGGSSDDFLFGDGGNDWLQGNGGNDNLYGGFGNDTLSGDGGNDYLSGQWGHDTLYGGWDTDLLTGGADNDYLDGGNDGANDTLYGDGGYDTMVQYHRRVFWWWSNEETLADLNSGMDTVIHVYVG
jgi:Ca2+-binding RTX toxin-like protein